MTSEPFFHWRASHQKSSTNRVSQLYRQLDQTQWSSAADIVNGQLAYARLLIKHCISAVPYYREVLTNASPPDQLTSSIDAFRQLPILERAVLQGRFDELQAERLPQGSEVSSEGSTSGTTGVPVRVRRTNQVDLWWGACFLRDLRWCGMDPRGRLASIRLTSPDVTTAQPLPSWLAGLEQLIECGPSLLIPLHADLEEQVRWIEEFGPNYILGNPSHLAALAGMIAERQIPLDRLRGVQTIAEALESDVRRQIESSLGVPVRNTYSCEEAGYLASPCPDGHGLHVHAENVLLEVLDEGDEPCSVGKSGRVVITTLHNFQMPLIRYDMGDEATIGGTCPCGRGLPLLLDVQGKRRPLWTLPDGTCVNTAELAPRMRAAGGVRQFQVVRHAADRWSVKIVPEDMRDDELETRLQAAIASLTFGSVAVTITTTPRIVPNSGGKVLDFIE